MATLIATANWPALGVFNPGPYERSDGALFTFWSGSGKTVVQPYKSTNGGVSWSASTTGPTLNSAGSGFFDVAENDSRLSYFDCRQSGDTVYVAWLNDSAQIIISRFDLNAETWSTWASGGPTVIEDTTGSNHHGFARLAWCDDGAGGWVFHYHGTAELTHYALVNSGGTWTTTGVLVSENVPPDITPAGDSVRPLWAVRVGRLVHFGYTWRVVSERALNLDTLAISTARYVVDASANGGLASQNNVIMWGEPQTTGSTLVAPVISTTSGPFRATLSTATSTLNGMTWTEITPPVINFSDSFGGGPYPNTPIYTFSQTSPGQTARLPSPVSVVVSPDCFQMHWTVTNNGAGGIYRAEYQGGAWQVHTTDRPDPVFVGYSEAGSEIGPTSATVDQIIAVYTRTISTGIGLCYVFRSTNSSAHEVYYQLAEDMCCCCEDYVF